MGKEETQPLQLTRGTHGYSCPIKKTLDILGNKWTFLIIRDLLLDGTMRFSDIRKSLGGISPKTLSLRLRDLEEKGLVKRKVYPEVPPRVEYCLTEKGLRLETILLELKRFGLEL